MSGTNPDSNLPSLPPATGKAFLARPPLVPERSDFFDGGAPAADKVQAFLTRSLEASDGSDTVAGALVIDSGNIPTVSHHSCRNSSEVIDSSCFGTEI